MNRHSSKRCLKALIGQMVIPSTLAFALVVGPVALPAQERNRTQSSQAETEDNGRARAENFLRQARAELKNKRFQAARELVERARAADPEASGIERLEKDIANAERKEQEAEAKRVQARTATAVRQHIAAAEDALKRNDFDLARRAEEEARKAAAGGGFERDLNRLAGKIQDAESREASRRNEASIQANLERANAQLRAEQFEAARESVNRVLQLDRQNRDANRLLSRIRDKERDFQAGRAEREARQEIEAANRLLSAGRFEDAETSFRSILARDSRNRDARRGLDRAQEGIRDQKAREASRVVVAARRELELGNIGEASLLLVQATELAPGSREVRNLERDIESEKEDQAEAAAREVADAEKAGRQLAEEQRRTKQAEARRLADEQRAAERRAAEEQKVAERRQAEERKVAAQAERAEQKRQAAAERKNAELAAAQAEEERVAEEARVAAEAAAAKAEEERNAAELAAAQAEEERVAEEARVAAEAAAAKAEEERKAAELAAAQAEEERVAAEEAARIAQEQVDNSSIEVAQADIAESEEEEVVTERFIEERITEVTVPEAAISESPFLPSETDASPFIDDSATATPPVEEGTAPFIDPEPAATDASPFVDEAPVTAVTPTPTPSPTAVPAVEQSDAREEAQAAAQAAREEERLRLQSQAEIRERAERAYQDGLNLYRQGELARARQRWLDAKEIDPTFTKADTYLAETEREFNQYLAQRAAQEAFEAREAAAIDKMNTLIPMSTTEPLTLSEFLSNLRLLSGIDFVIIGEVQARVEAAFEDEPLHRVLDKTLIPMGLRWEREPGSHTVIVTPDLRTEVFSVPPDQLHTVESLLREGVIQRLLYGPAGTPVLQGQEIATDPRQSIVIMTDSQANLTKFRRFLEGLQGAPGTQLIYDSFEIDESKAPEIKALIEAILAVDERAPYSPETRLILEGSTLIIRDTVENVQRVRQLLQDHNFLSKFYSDSLSIATFNLTPIIEFEDNPDLVRQFAEQVRQVVETLLYAREGRSKAEREGRRMWFDPATLQLTITDYPDNLEAVQDYIEALPQIRARRRSKIIFLDWATAGDLVAQIESFLGIAPAAVGAASAANEITRNMRVEDVVEFQGASFRVIRVNENDLNDENDDDVELVVRTGTTSQEVTIQQFRSQFVEDFEIVAGDIRPSGTPGEGRARLTIRFSPQTGAAGIGGGIGVAGQGGLVPGPAGLVDPAALQRQELRQETGLTLVDIENLNALFVQYDNVEDLRQVEFWVRTLDIPTLQVSIEIKFVEVITNKAKEYKPEFTIADLTQGISLTDSVLRSRFAQDRDEFRSPYEPGVETPSSANLLKGSTVFNFIAAGGNSPLSFQLKMLEAQGIINVVNGPSVTVLNNETADFQVERRFGIPRPLEGQTGGGGGGQQAQLTAVAGIQPVDLSVTPTVTRAGNITLDIDVEMNDFDQNLGQLVQLSAATGPEETLIPQEVAVQNNFADLGVLRKSLTTQARISDGGTVVLGGWRNERSEDLESGIPILRDIPYIGRYLFNRTQKTDHKITLLIFLTGQVVRD